MRIAILDPFAGIAGDMLLGALVDTGVDADWVRALPRRAGFPDVQVRIDQVDRCSVRCTKVDFDIEVDQTSAHGRHVSDLIGLVRNSDFSPAVQAAAVNAFQLVGEAEGKVHGLPADRVHLHEVGAIDALLDILGGIGGMEHLGVEVVHHLPVAVGDGWVTAEHGTLPVPAPATVELLQGIDVRLGGPVEGEAATPTGAALLRVLSSGPPPETCRVQAVGLGAGTRNPKHYPNALRLLVAETASEAAVVQVLATDIDDMTPEYLEPLRSAVFEAGALDCVVWPTQGKKGRVAMRIEAVAPPAVADDVARVLFLHTSTGGIRRTLAQRSTLARREASVELESEIRVRIKVWETPGGRRFKAEFEDVVLAARHLERSPIEIARTAEDLARKRWGNGETENRGEEKE